MISEVRTSQSYRFESKNNEVCAGILSVFARITSEPVSHFERPTVIRYQCAQYYRPHLDAFSDSKISHREHLQRAGQRLNTFILSLQRAQSGGETHFPSLGLSVLLNEGDLLIFHNLDEKKLPSFKVLHESMTVGRGEKWVLTTWSRELPIA